MNANVRRGVAVGITSRIDMRIRRKSGSNARSMPGRSTITKTAVTEQSELSFRCERGANRGPFVGTGVGLFLSRGWHRAPPDVQPGRIFTHTA